jgi:hypothetical protein
VFAERVVVVELVFVTAGGTAAAAVTGTASVLVGAAAVRA